MQRQPRAISSSDRVKGVRGKHPRRVRLESIGRNGVCAPAATNAALPCTHSAVNARVIYTDVRREGRRRVPRRCRRWSYRRRSTGHLADGRQPHLLALLVEGGLHAELISLFFSDKPCRPRIRCVRVYVCVCICFRDICIRPSQQTMLDHTVYRS